MDIKPENLLLTYAGDLQIIDFNCSYCWDVWPKGPIQSGTSGFMAPEIEEADDQLWWQEKEPAYWGAADIWSSGVTLLAWLVALIPDFILEACSIEPNLKTNFFPQDSDEAKQILTSLDEHRSEMEEMVGLGLDLIHQMMLHDPYQRWTAAKCLTHPFVSVSDPSSLKKEKSFHLNKALRTKRKKRKTTLQPKFSNKVAP
jgi:serine/threonine protein kinase